MDAAKKTLENAVVTWVILVRPVSLKCVLGQVRLSIQMSRRRSAPAEESATLSQENAVASMPAPAQNVLTRVVLNPVVVEGVATHSPANVHAKQGTREGVVNTASAPATVGVQQVGNVTRRVASASAKPDIPDRHA